MRGGGARDVIAGAGQNHRYPRHYLVRLLLRLVGEERVFALLT